MHRQLTYTDRLQIEALIKGKHNQSEISRIIGVNHSTISREIRRGLYTRLNTDYTTSEVYAADVAQRKIDAGKKNKGAPLKIGNDIEYANYIEYKISKEHYSPRAVLGEIKVKKMKFNTTLSVPTVYRYINDGLFLTLTNKDLPIKKNKRKNTYHKVRAARPPRGTSIDKRPAVINSRAEFGHWEMDSVEGTKGSGALLVLTERMTRQELIFKLKAQTSENVVKTLNTIENKLSTAAFQKLFKSITMDNGKEFQDNSGIMSGFGGEIRTATYYCHPSCPSERGSNENANRLVRRFYPKGTSFLSITDADTRKLMQWINNYPREIFNYYCSNDLFTEFLAKEGLENINVNKL